MAHRTALPAPAADAQQPPPNIRLLRTTVRRALFDARVMTDTDRLSALARTLRTQMTEVIPAVEEVARRQPQDSPSRFCAIACVGEARRKLRMGDGESLRVRVAVLEKLGRSLNALCDHYETLAKS